MGYLVSYLMGRIHFRSVLGELYVTRVENVYNESVIQIIAQELSPGQHASSCEHALAYNDNAVSITAYDSFYLLANFA